MCIYIAKKIHEQKVFIQLSITRFPTDDKSVIQKKLVFFRQKEIDKYKVNLKNLFRICFENNKIR